jgi:hypothetical protein
VRCQCRWKKWWRSKEKANKRIDWKKEILVARSGVGMFGWHGWRIFWRGYDFWFCPLFEIPTFIWFCLRSSVAFPHEKVPLFLGHAFSCGQDWQPYFKICRKEGMLPIYRMMPIILGLLGSIAVFGCAPISESFGLCAEFTDAYNMTKLCSQRHSIDMNCILLCMKFKGTLSILILKKWGNSSQKFGVQNRWAFKSSRFACIDPLWVPVPSTRLYALLGLVLHTHAALCPLLKIRELFFWKLLGFGLQLFWNELSFFSKPR